MDIIKIREKLLKKTKVYMRMSQKHKEEREIVHGFSCIISVEQMKRRVTITRLFSL